MMGKDGMRYGHGSFKMGLALIVIGLIFLLGALEVIDKATVAILWPIVIILVGLSKLCRGSCGCGHDKK